MSNSPPVPRTWRRWFRRFIFRMSVVFLVYTLSIGPCFWYWFEATYVDGSKWWVALYFPLVLLCDLIPPFGRLVNWYINLWIL